MQRCKTLSDIHKALDSNKEVFWGHSGYKVHYIPNRPELLQYSEHDGKLIRISYVETYFGSLIQESEVTNCFIK